MAGPFDNILSMLGLDSLFFYLDKITALFLIWWLGGKFSGKFESKLPKWTGLFLRIISGVLIYWSGVVIATSLLTFVPSSIGDIVGALFAFTVFSIIGGLFTHGIPTKIVSRKDFQSLLDKVERLEALVDRLVDANTEKHILPKTMDKDETSDTIKELMEKRGVKEFELLALNEEKNVWHASVKCKIRTFNISLDAVSGDVLKFSHSVDSPKNRLLSFLNYFYTHKPAVLAVLFLFVFLSYISSLSNDVSELRFMNLLSAEPIGTQDSQNNADAGSSGIEGLSSEQQALLMQMIASQGSGLT